MAHTGQDCRAHTGQDCRMGFDASLYLLRAHPQRTLDRTIGREDYFERFDPGFYWGGAHSL